MLPKWVRTAEIGGHATLTTEEGRRDARIAKVNAREQALCALMSSEEVSTLTSSLIEDTRLNHFTELLSSSFHSPGGN